MDKTLEIVVAVAVLMMVAAILFFMISDSSSDFGQTTDDQVSDSECRLLQSQWELASSSEKEEIESEAANKGCDITGGTSSSEGSSDSDGTPTGGIE